MTELQVYNFFGREVTIHCTDGESVSGFFCAFTPSYDNDPEIAEAVLDIDNHLIEVPVPDIDHIDLIRSCLEK